MEKDCLGKNLQTVIPCNIIQDRLFLNYLQRIVIEKALNHTIVNKRRQYQDKSDQFLLYIRKKGGVGKSRVIKAIYLRFNFLKKQSELLIIAPTDAVMANIRDATIHKTLSIDKRVQSKKRHMAKN